LSNHCRDRSFLICAAVGFFDMGQRPSGRYGMATPTL
jgi:hypothetical protein